MADNTQTIIDTILSDITGVIPNFSSLVSSYRLLVGAAEELLRTPGVPFEIFERAVIRSDRTGTLIDILLELLCCKIAFSSQFLAITCAPVDLIRLLANCGGPLEEASCRTAEEIIILALIGQVLGRHCDDHSCFGPPPEGIGITPPKPPAPPPASEKSNNIQSNLETTKELETEVTTPIASPFYRYTSPLSRRHI